MKRITLVCGAGMSTSLLVVKMVEAAKKLDIEAKIIAVAEAELKHHIEDTDVLLLGPQVRFLLSKYKGAYEPKGIKVDVINSMDYGLMNGEKVLQHALTLLSQ
ncbi:MULTISPECIES: PTS sugar transporter subunit IIB [Clostridium]|uniref:PTS sugar transporter subunit IIB n=1 Tax=Clostridium TaxID=1485 RepID=UPI00031382EC|nr:MULTISPECIES: PTS sugar transporter subunit IIB [Clostridium]